MSDTNTTEYVGYVSDPNGRGTCSLILSCLLTLILCVWSALHLNVPPAGRSSLETFWLIMRWVLAGIYAPEMVVFAAWRQWSSARILTTVIEESKGNRWDSVKASEKGQEHSWSRTHAFYACSGGFAIDTGVAGDAEPGNARIRDTESSRVRLSLTSRGVAMLARCGHLPNVEKRDIEDKSKANDLAKALVIIQAAWMLLQVIARLITGLPVTLLETNTVAHVLCAFLMYAMWWHKPLLPQEPLVLRKEELDPLSSFMFLSSEISGSIDKTRRASETPVKTLFAAANLYSKAPEMEQLRLQLHLHVSGSSESLLISKLPHHGSENRNEAVRQVERLLAESANQELRFSPASDNCDQILRLDRKQNNGTAFFERRPRVVALDLKQHPTSSATSRRWKLAAQALIQHPSLLSSHLEHAHQIDESLCLHFRSEQLLATHVQNWPWDDLLRDVDGLVVGMILWLANLVYGGIHLGAWNTHFPTIEEQWMWRVSALYITFCGGLWVTLNGIVSSSPKLNDFWEKWMQGKENPFWNVALGALVFVCGTMLALARAFIVVEAFLSIRQLPRAAYDTPSWTQVFPHF